MSDEQDMQQIKSPLCGGFPDQLFSFCQYPTSKASSFMSGRCQSCCQLRATTTHMVRTALEQDLEFSEAMSYAVEP
jgi:hypothetical protein